MPKWTNQQKQAIETRGRSIIVSAAAGSGKTAVLVERLVRILSDTREAYQIPADRMIVVTFTNDAAAQMKQRLSAKLSERIAALSESEDEDAYQWLLMQRARLSAAKISTIHKFCFDLIRENADSLGISPQFDIADTAQVTTCRRRALDRVMERWTSEEADMPLLYNYFCAKNDSDLEALLLQIADDLGSLAFPQRWMQQALTFAEHPDTLFEQMRDAFCGELETILRFYRRTDAIAEKARPSHDPKTYNYHDKLEADCAQLEAHLQFVRSAPMETLCAELSAHQATFLKFPTKRKTDALHERDIFRKAADVVKKRYETLLKKRLEPMRFFAEDAALSAQLIPPLLRLTQEYMDAFSEEKRRQNVLDFNDAEDFTLRLLADLHEDGSLERSVLAQQLSGQYDLIMVDEYQDTNNKQDSIFKLLSQNARIDQTGIHYGDNVFLVGDVKQSIYAFRRANPENFRRVIAESTPLPDCTAKEMALIYLNQNFRSARGVLDFVNALFFAIMRETCGDVHYNANEQLNFGSPVYPEAAMKTQLLLARDGDPLPVGSTLQAECIADTIAQMLGRTLVLGIDDDGNPTQRTAEPGDFCILLRSVSGNGKPFIEALARRGIDVMADDTAGLLGLPEIRLIRNLLRITDNPMTDTAMAAVLLSPIYGLTAEDLVLLRLYSSQRRLYRQMQALADCEEPPAELRDLQRKVQNVMSDLHEMLDATEQMPLEEAIWEIYRMTDLLALQSLHTEAEEAAVRRSHLESFALLAKNYRKHADLTASSHLAGWLRSLERLEENGKDLETKAGSHYRSCVRIKTMHKSKGLQYPFVFLACLEKTMSTNPSDQPVQTGEDGTVGLRLYDRSRCVKADTAAYSHLLAQVYRKQTSEELRLFYVALTRAEQQLFLVIDHPEGGKTVTTAAGKLGEMLHELPEMVEELAPYAQSMQDWLLYFLFVSRDAEHFLRLMDGEESSGEYADYRLYHYQETAVAQPLAETVQAVDADADALAQMRRQLAFRYETEQSSLVSKYSVTQLAHPETGVLDLPRSPQFTLDGKRGGFANLKGAARGTAVHKIMQLIDFDLAAHDAKAALDALYASGALNQMEYESITPEKLQAFFTSDLFARIRRADRIERERKIFDLIGDLHLPDHPEITKRYAGTDGVLIGTMDLVFHEPDGWVIVDYKTDYATAGASLLREYTLQLQLYRAAAEHIFGEPVKELYLYAFSLDQTLQITDK